MYGNGLLKKLPTPTALVAIVGAVTVLPAPPFRFLTVIPTIRAVRATALAFVSHFIKVALSTDIDKFCQAQI